MIVLTHPTGNQNVRQALLALEQASLLERFYTTVYWDPRWKINALLPPSVRSELNRRSYSGIPASKIHLDPIRTGASFFYQKVGLTPPHYLSILKIYESLDRLTASTLRQLKPQSVYAYEGGALETFREAKSHNIKCIYELPSGFWYHEVDLFREEADLRPEYAGTLPKLKDPPGHNEKKDQELALADQIIVPSSHVARTLKRTHIPAEKLRVIPYGANDPSGPVRQPGASKHRKLRVLFVGALTQRKGIGYLIDAVDQLADQIEFTMLGSRVGTSDCLDNALRKYRWIPTAPHADVLAEMSAHDVLVHPALSEGFGLVISEALSRGLPVITTRNSGGPEIIDDGIQGFFVNIRSSEEIVEKLELLDRDRERLDSMSCAAVQRAADFSWQRYRKLLVSTIQPPLN